MNDFSSAADLIVARDPEIEFRVPSSTLPLPPETAFPCRALASAVRGALLMKRDARRVSETAKETPAPVRPRCTPPRNLPAMPKRDWRAAPDIAMRTARKGIGRRGVWCVRA